jgi:hypothetical protein
LKGFVVNAFGDGFCNGLVRAVCIQNQLVGAFALNAKYLQSHGYVRLLDTTPPIL